MPALSTTLTVTRLALGPIIAAFLFWAANELYSDRLLAGFIYALCCFLVAASWVISLFGENSVKQSAPTRWTPLERIAPAIVVTCILAPLAYAALPLPLVAAGTIIILGNWIEAYARGDAKENEWTGWRLSAEMSGLAAFFAARASALLFAPETIIVGLDWAALILLWAAAGLALICVRIYAPALLKAPSVEAAKLDDVQNEHHNDKNADGNDRGH